MSRHPDIRPAGEPPHVLVAAATAGEQDQLLAALAECVQYTAHGRHWASGRLGCCRVMVLQTGIGATNTAQALTCALQLQRPDLVVQVGVGGAYPGAGLQVGDLALASEENYGDLGVRTPRGWQPARALGMPVLEQDGLEYYNRFPLDAAAVRRAAAALEAITWETPVRVGVGPFVSVQECSGTAALGAEREHGFGAICESMEGAAAAHICRLYDVLLIELRGISNLVEDRRRDRWDVPLAARRSQRAACHLIEQHRQ